jgi:thioester reductase-like protein
MDAAQNSPVSEFLNKQTIFVTGITGFLGKVILAQLLRNCPTIPRIFVLIRGRKGKTAAERFKEEVLSQEIFHDILEANPAIRTKITVCVLPRETTSLEHLTFLHRGLQVVEGDIVKAKLGISTEAETRITAEATVFIHCAATTKFTENLRVAIDMNVIGSMRVLELAKKCNSLCSYVHVSTAYVNCNQISERGEVIEEKIYPIRCVQFKYHYHHSNLIIFV